MSDDSDPTSRAPATPRIRSFVLRQGRVSNAQQRAYDTLLPRLGIAYRRAPIDIAATFGRVAPLTLEIGFGMGETTALIAAEHPERDYLGIEVHTPGVGALLKEIEARGLANLRVIQHDAVEVLEHMIAPDSLAAIHIFFPDPWPKKRHHKRRLIAPAFAALATSRLRPGGYLHVATDWAEYAEHVLTVLNAEPALVNPSGGFAERPASRPVTKFELRGLRLGHRVWDVLVHRR